MLTKRAANAANGKSTIITIRRHNASKNWKRIKEGKGKEQVNTVS